MGLGVCPVHQSQIKNTHIPSIHVDAMLCDPQPKGLKRKYPDDEERDATTTTTTTTTEAYNQQRQEIFKISYEKLCKFRQAPESSLLRYVLIFNTMRNVEQEMERDGIKINCMSAGPFLPPVNCQVSTLDPPPSPYAIGEGMPPPPMGFPPSPYAVDMDSKPVLPSVINAQISQSESMFSHANCATGYSTEYDRCLVEFDASPSGRMTPFVRTTYDRSESGALWTDETDRLTSLNWSSVLNFNSGSSGIGSSYSSPASVRNSTLSCDQAFDVSNCGNSSSTSGISDTSITDDAMCSSETSLHTLMPPVMGASSSSNLSITYSSSPSNSPNTSPSSGHASPASGSSPTSSEDEIFGDIDLTLYDFDLLSPLSPPNVRMAPVSAEELMRSLSNNADVANACPMAGYYDKSEHYSDEREHVATSVKS